MKKTERMNGIVLLLQDKGRMTAPQLAHYFEVSERTIYRDIDALSQLKVPVIAYEGIGGGYEVATDYFMPSIQLSQEEVRVLLMVLKMGESSKMPNLQGTYASLRGKLLNSLDSKRSSSVDELMSRIQFFMSRIEPTVYEAGVFQRILNALEQRKRLKIKYYTPKENVYNERDVSLQNLFFEEGGWYMRGFCHLREESRTFRIDRIQEADILDLPIYLPDKLTSKTDRFVLRDYVLELSPALYRVIKENDYMNKHKVISHKENYRVEIKTTLNQEILALALSHGEDMRVVSPIEVVNEIKAHIKKLKNKYENPDI